MIAQTSALRPPERFVDDVVPVALHWSCDGLRTALVTLVGVDGNAPRPLGSQMLVNESGAWVGQISSDCAEEAIAREALDCIANGCARTVRFGKGSKYMDVRLPCGSGLDVHFDPCVPASVYAQLAEARHVRMPASLVWSDVGGGHDSSPPHATHRVIPTASLRRANTPSSSYARHFSPPTRLLIAGRGSHAAALTDLALQLDWDVVIASSDTAFLARAATRGATTTHLPRPEYFDPSAIDSWTAVVLLFHDHDWEPPILTRVLERQPFYIGALGSRAAHAERLRRLQAMGVRDDAMRRIRGPVGLDIGARTPPDIALAIAAEIVAARQTVPCLEIL